MTTEQTPPPADGPIVATDQPTLTLEGVVVTRHDKPALDLTCEGQRLSEHQHLVEHRLEKLGSYQVRIADFDHEAQHYVLHALTIEADGALTPWSRVDGAVVSPDIGRPGEGSTELRFVVIAVCPETQKALAEPYPGVLNVTMLTGGGDDETRGG